MVGELAAAADELVQMASQLAEPLDAARRSVQLLGWIDKSSYQRFASVLHEDVDAARIVGEYARSSDGGSLISEFLLVDEAAWSRYRQRGRLQPDGVMKEIETFRSHLLRSLRPRWWARPARFTHALALLWRPLRERSHLVIQRFRR